MKMYNASNIEEDMKNDAEVERANNVLLSPKPNQNVRVVSPTAVEDVKAIEKGTKAKEVKKSNDEDEEDWDEEVAGINKGIIEVGVTQRTRQVTRYSRDSYGGSVGSSVGRVGKSGESMREIAKEAVKEFQEEIKSEGEGDININITGQSNIKVTARSRPSSSMSNPSSRPGSQLDSLITDGRRKSFDNISALRQVKMAKGEDGSPVGNRSRNCLNCPPGMVGGIGPNFERMWAESASHVRQDSGTKKRPHFLTQSVEGMHFVEALKSEPELRVERANSMGDVNGVRSL